MKLLFLMLNLYFQADTLQAYLQKLDPEIRVSMAVHDAKGHQLFGLNDSVSVASASVIKIPILMEFMFQLEAKKIKLKDEYRLKNEDKVGGSGNLQFEAEGKIFTLEELATAMIAVSDNVATNILIDKLGADNINEMLKYHGWQKTQLNRKMMDFKAILQGKQNYTNVIEINEMLQKALSKQLFSRKIGKKLIEILLTCEDVKTIPRHFSKQIPIAHKSGTLDYIRGDAGIIFGKSPLILSIFIENFVTIEQAEHIIGDLAYLANMQFGSLDMKMVK